MADAGRKIIAVRLFDLGSRSEVDDVDRLKVSHRSSAVPVPTSFVVLPALVSFPFTTSKFQRLFRRTVLTFVCLQNARALVRFLLMHV